MERLKVGMMECNDLILISVSRCFHYQFHSTHRIPLVDGKAQAANLSSYFSQADNPDHEHPLSIYKRRRTGSHAAATAADHHQHHRFHGDKGHGSSVKHTTTGLCELLGWVGLVFWIQGAASWVPRNADKRQPRERKHKIIVIILMLIVKSNTDGEDSAQQQRSFCFSCL